MWDWVRIAEWSVVSALKSQRDLALENAALRHQLPCYEATVDHVDGTGAIRRVVTGEKQCHMRDFLVGAVAFHGNHGFNIVMQTF